MEGADFGEDILCRVSVVNQLGQVCFDTLVKPHSEVTQGRMWLHGIHGSHLKEAPELGEVQAALEELLKERLVVGHTTHKDLECLELEGVKFVDIKCFDGKDAQPKKLKHLCRQHLNLAIQADFHSSVRSIHFSGHRRKDHHGSLPFEA